MIEEVEPKGNNAFVVWSANGSGVTEYNPAMWRPDLCRVFWRSHGCDLPRFHEGDSHSHECEPCPPDCRAPDDETWGMGSEGKPWMADCTGSCSVHCGDRPTHDDVLYGEDVDHFPQRAGYPKMEHSV